MKVPSTTLARRIAALVKRRPTTAWSDRELREYKKLFKAGCFDALDDLELLEQFYAFQHKRGDNGIHRRDLLTLLNNWSGEMDRATLWREQHPLRSERKIIPMPPVQSVQPTVTAEPEVVEKFLVEYREHKARKRNCMSEISKDFEFEAAL